MAVHPSFITLEKALASHRIGNAREALAMSAAAWRMVNEIPGAPPDAAIVGSWYGLMLGTVEGRIGEGMVLCRDAVRKMFWEPRAHENLARLEIAAGLRKQAIQTLARGLSLAPDDREMKSLRASLGTRRRPTVGFLDRSHPINRWVGLLTTRPEG